MEYAVYKLDFKTSVHFGNGMLSDTGVTFCADTLFSALYIEAMKIGKDSIFLSEVTQGKLLFTDAFPYIGDQYYLPKPMLYVEPQERGNSSDKKKIKRMKYIPAEEVDNFLNGTMDMSASKMDELGHNSMQVMAAIRSEKEDTLPYYVESYYFNKGNGLYIIAAYDDDEDRELLDELLESLSYTGIGGKRASGKGKFLVKIGKKAEPLLKLLDRESSKHMLLSSALPKEDELEKSLDGASYLLQKRSGFVYSDTYAEEQRKKQELFVFQVGSCFTNCFDGDIYDVGNNGVHSVYRYAKPIFMGV